MMIRLLSTALALAIANVAIQAQAPPEAAGRQNPVELTAQQDHQRVLDLLHIKYLRPGVSADGSGPFPVNYDESKANPWPTLPDPLLLASGKRVIKPEMWWRERRPEIVELFDREYLGRVPAKTPRVRWQVTSISRGNDDGIATITKHLTGLVDTSDYPSIIINIEADLTLPERNGPIPVVLEFSFEPYPRLPIAAKNTTSKSPPPYPGPTWKQQVLAKGWGYALLYPKSIQENSGEGLTHGIIGFMNRGQPRKLDDWGTLKAWAWGGSRLLDYFETDKDVDAAHVAVEGHSIFGKTALVAMAYDQRFAVAYISSSGSAGTELARRRFGEQIENNAAVDQYQRLAGNYLKYSGTFTPADMPVDTHELIALCAPRPVFIGGGVTKGDGWADNRGSFMAEVAAGPVYRLLGRKDLGTSTFPPVGTALISGALGFRQHSEGHIISPNWPTFILFATPYM